MTQSRKDRNLPLTGFPNVDRQHLEIYHGLHALQNCLSKNCANTSSLELCRSLFNSYREHFDEEELLMLKSFYPDTEAHIGLHMYCLNILSNLVNTIQNGNTPTALEAVDFLIRWQEDHVSDADLHFSNFINESPV